MPISLVIDTIAQSHLPISHTQGKVIHGLFYEILKQADLNIAERLHKTEGAKPFTTSVLYHTTRPMDRVRGSERLQRGVKNQTIPAGEEVKFRITFLEHDIFQFVSRPFLENPDFKFTLVQTPLIISRLSVTNESKEPWAGFASFQEIHEQASVSDREITLQFYTPTAFKQTLHKDAPELAITIPVPRLIFQSHLRSWNQYAPSKIDEDILAYIEASVEVSRCRIETRDTPLTFLHANGEYRTEHFTGFIGNCTFRLKGKPSPEIIKSLNTLADFAFYCGTGMKTTMGMGLTRRIYYGLR